MPYYFFQMLILLIRPDRSSILLNANVICGNLSWTHRYKEKQNNSHFTLDILKTVQFTSMILGLYLDQLAQVVNLYDTGKSLRSVKTENYIVEWL